MNQLLYAIERAGVPFEAAASGRWVRFQGETCVVYVVQAERDPHFMTWCERWDNRHVERYLTVEEAITAGMRRAATPIRPPLSSAPLLDVEAAADASLASAVY